jgi:hypothetical protein
MTQALYAHMNNKRKKKLKPRKKKQIQEILEEGLEILVWTIFPKRQ